MIYTLAWHVVAIGPYVLLAFAGTFLWNRRRPMPAFLVALGFSAAACSQIAAAYVSAKLSAAVDSTGASPWTCTSIRAGSGLPTSSAQSGFGSPRQASCLTACADTRTASLTSASGAGAVCRHPAITYERRRRSVKSVNLSEAGYLCGVCGSTCELGL